jgi:hypothetical protein
MEEYKISMQEGITYIENAEQAFKMSVQKDRELKRNNDTAVLEATLYIEDGVFIRNATYIFEALSPDNKPLINHVNLDDFKEAVDFFFMSILNTDLYIKSIPKASSFCPQAQKTFQFE